MTTIQEELLVHVHLKAAHIVILLTFFAKLSDPYLIFKEFKDIKFVLDRVNFSCLRERIRMAATGSKLQCTPKILTL